MVNTEWVNGDFLTFENTQERLFLEECSGTISPSFQKYVVHELWLNILHIIIGAYCPAIIIAFIFHTL